MNIDELKQLADAADESRNRAAKKECWKQVENVVKQAEVAARSGCRQIEYKGSLNQLAISHLKSERFFVEDVAEEGYCYRIWGW
jgi:hypothetical protein